MNLETIPYWDWQSSFRYPHFHCLTHSRKLTAVVKVAKPRRAAYLAAIQLEKDFFPFFLILLDNNETSGVEQRYRSSSVGQEKKRLRRRCLLETFEQVDTKTKKMAKVAHVTRKISSRQHTGRAVTSETSQGAVAVPAPFTQGRPALGCSYNWMERLSGWGDLTLKGNTDGNSRMRENNSTTTWTSAAETSSAPTTVCQQQKKTKTKRPTLFPSSSLTVHTHEELKAAPPNEKWSGLRVKVLANWITRERESRAPSFAPSTRL